MRSTHPPALNPRTLDSPFSPEFLATCILCAAWVLWLLSLPLFPTQDGPMHLYYVHILEALLSGQPGPYAHVYIIKHILPPYSFYYYLLMLLSRVVPLLVADKLVIALYFVLFVFGFRYLARAIGPGADRATLLATLLLLNWPLAMGFVNFSLSVALGLWALGLWTRAAGHHDPGRRIAFVLLAIVIMMTHPVPLLGVLLAAGISLLPRLFRWARTRALPPFLLKDILTLALAAATLGYVALFTTAHPLNQLTQHAPFFTQLKLNLVNYYTRIAGLRVLAARELPGKLLLLAVLLLVPFSLVMAGLQWRRNRAAALTTRGDFLLYAALVFAILLPFLPHDLNASHFFAERLMIVLWILSLLAFAGVRPPARPDARSERRTAIPLLLFALVVNALMLYTANRAFRPVARDIASIESSPVTHPGQTGIALYALRDETKTSGNLTTDPYEWSSVDFFRHNNAVLYNTPWLDLGIIPIGRAPEAAPVPLSPKVLEETDTLRVDMATNPIERAALLHNAQFIIFTSSQSPRVPAAAYEPIWTKSLDCPPTPSPSWVVCNLPPVH